MTYAPRPLEKYAYLERPYSLKKDLKSIVNSFFARKDSSSSYEPFSSHPLCFEGNQDILATLGLKDYEDLLLQNICAGTKLFEPTHDPLQEGRERFLQSGFLLSESEQEFYYDMGGRLFLAGFLFCRTPEDTKQELEQGGFESGSWMLDQVHFYAGGKFTNILCDQRSDHNMSSVMNLLHDVQDINQAHHLDIIDKESLFFERMNAFDDCYIRHKPSQIVSRQSVLQPKQ